MPWLVATEIAKLLNVGGHVFVETHFSYSSHERPWHFFQFTDMALKLLFNEALGFECIEAGVSNPIVGRFSTLADPPFEKPKSRRAVLSLRVSRQESPRCEGFRLGQRRSPRSSGRNKIPGTQILTRLPHNLNRCRVGTAGLLKMS